jgi:predicted Zn-dependent peptidase
MVVFNKKVLSNGLTVIHEKRDVSVTSVMLAVSYGAMYENEDEKGVSHLIEHLCFKGTEKRDAKEISESIESVGGELNAFTHEETTAYYAKIPSNYLELAVDVLGDIFFNSSFPLDEVQREKNVICEEIKMYHDNTVSHTIEMLKSNLYERPYGMFIGGNGNAVKSFTREYLLKKHKEVYIPKNSVLCVVGNNTFEDVVDFAEKYIGFERDGKIIGKIDIIEKKGDSTEEREGVLQSNLAIGTHIRYNGKMRFAIEVFNSIFGDGMTSKLFREVREKRGLVYAIKSEIDLGRNYAYLLIYAGTDFSKTSEVIELSKKIFYEMKDITEIDLEKAKIRIIGNRKVHSEESNETALELVFNEMYSKAEDHYNYDENIKSVTLEDIKEIISNADFSSFILKNK